MATVEQAEKLHASAEMVSSSRRFDLLVAVLSVSVVAGLFIDGWAHNTFEDLIETFFTPWHAILYSSFAATGAVLAGRYVWSLARGADWRAALPDGYELSLLGAIIFGAGGIFDFGWHELFGFEVDVEALLSPSHFLLAVGFVLVGSGPLRAAWHRGSDEQANNWMDMLPVVLSLLALFSVFTFFVQFSSPYGGTNLIAGERPTGELRLYLQDTAQVSYVIVYSLIMMSFILFAIRRWSLPRGALTLLLTVNAAGMFFMAISRTARQWPVLIAALLGGIVADLLLVGLKPSTARIRQLRWFAFLTPFIYFLIYFLTLIVTGGIWWRIHMWLGAPVLAGVIGLGLSMLLAPPPIASE